MEKAFEIDEVELTKKLRQVVWDYDISDEDLLAVFLHDKKVPGLGSTQLKAKLLNGNNWYSLLKLLGIENAKKMLTIEITSILFPRQLRERYQHAQQLLSE
jgi:hypothetical protein